MMPVSSVAPLVTNMLLFSDLLRQAVVLEGAVEGGVEVLDHKALACFRGLAKHGSPGARRKNPYYDASFTSFSLPNRPFFRSTPGRAHRGGLRSAGLRRGGGAAGPEVSAGGATAIARAAAR